MKRNSYGNRSVSSSKGWIPISRHIEIKLSKIHTLKDVNNIMSYSYGRNGQNDISQSDSQLNPVQSHESLDKCKRFLSVERNHRVLEDCGKISKWIFGSNE